MMAEQTSKTESITSIPLAFSEAGTRNAIFYLADLYGDPYSTPRELVQNALDKGATRIEFFVDAVGSAVTGPTIKCFDNGDGASQDEITRKFTSIAESLNVGKPETAGEKGIGNLAGLAIASKYKIITRDRKDPRDPFRVYEIERPGPNKPFTLRIEPVTWKKMPGATNIDFEVTTVVHILGVNAAAIRKLTNPDLIERTIVTALSPIIRRRGAKIRIVVRSSSKEKAIDRKLKFLEFRGTLIGINATETDFGPVSFQFFYNPEPVKDPTIWVEHRGVTNIPISNFVVRGILPREINEVLGKGFFEGVIRVSFCTINAQRDAFEWSEETKAFASAVNGFVFETLQPVIKQIEEEETREKYRKINRALRRRVVDFFKTRRDRIPERFADFLTDIEIVERKKEREKSKRKGKSAKEIKKLIEEKEERRKIKKGKKTDDKKDGETEVVIVKKEDRESPPNLKAAIELVVPDDYFDWRSRTTGNVIEINTIHRDFTAAGLLGSTRLIEYCVLLVCLEFTCAALSPAEAAIFRKSSEFHLMEFWGMNLS